MRLNMLLTIAVLLISMTSYSQTQAEMNKFASDDYKRASHELDSVFDEILKAYSDDSVFLKALKQSQDLWLTFRTAELKMRYPQREPGYYGSVHSMCISLYMAELTRARIEHLKNWLAVPDEGDACEGTRRPSGEREED